MSIAADPWADVPPPPEMIRTEPKRFTAVALSTVTTPTVERVTSSKALPLYLGMLVGLVGPSETGKSTLGAHAVLDVAASGQAVLVCDGEMSAPTWRRKLLELGATDDDLTRVFYAEMSTDSADVDLVRSAVTIRQIRLIVWDSALSLISRTAKSENDNAEVGRVFDRLRGIVRDGPAGLMIDHSSKDAANPVSRGASAKFAALDISYGIRLTDGCVPGPLATWSTIVSVEKDRHALLGNRADREVTYCPLGNGQLAIDVAELSGSSHRLSATNPVAIALASIAALDPPPVSANDAYKRTGGKRTTILAAHKLWCSQGGSGESPRRVRRLFSLRLQRSLGPGGDGSGLALLRRG
jgi:hypothetical protein